MQKSLSTRTHRCPNCGLVLDRDWNAALNILAAALVGAASLRTAGQVGTGSVSPEHIASGQTAGTRGVRKGTSQTGWMNEESPGASFGECQSSATKTVPCLNTGISLALKPPVCYNQ